MTIGERIKELRKQQGMTQSDLAKKLGIPYQSIGQWERGIRTPKPKTIFRIIEALGVDNSVFLQGLVSFEEISEEMDMPIELVKEALTNPDFKSLPIGKQAHEDVSFVGILLASELNPRFGSELPKEEKAEKNQSPAKTELLSMIDTMNEKELSFFLDLIKSIKQHNSDTTEN